MTTISPGEGACLHPAARFGEGELAHVCPRRHKDHICILDLFHLIFQKHNLGALMGEGRGGRVKERQSKLKEGEEMFFRLGMRQGLLTTQGSFAETKATLIIQPPCIPGPSRELW